MDKEKLREIVYLIVAIVLAILAVKFVIWLLPFILIILLASFLYGAMKKSKGNYSKDTNKKNKKVVIIDEDDGKNK